MSKKTSSKLLLDESPLTVSPTLAAAIGINAAIVLQQIQYWLKIAEKSKDTRKFKAGKWWTYNTYEQWQEQFPWLSASGVRKTIKQLKDANLIATVKHGTQGKDHTLWYTINYAAVDALEGKSGAEADPGKPRSEDKENHVSHRDTSTSGSMCPDGTGHVSQSDESYATETSAESSSEDSLRSSSANGEKPPPPENIKVQKPGKPKSQGYGQYAVGFLADVLKEAKRRGATPPPLTSRQRGEYGEFFAQAMRDGESVEDGEMVLRWLAAKACGDVPSEPEAWAYFGSGQRAVRDGWRPKANLRVVEDPEAKRKNDEEWDEILAEQQAMIRQAMGG